MAIIPEDHQGNAVVAALKELLSTKHLYQSVTVPRDFIDRRISEREDSMNSGDVLGLVIKQATLPWDFVASESAEFIPGRRGRKLPNIETFCGKCGGRKPFVPIEANSRSWGYCSDTFETATSGQAFQLSFECGGCQTETVDFLVIRRVMKLTIAGRWPLEEVVVPSHIPKCVRKLYSDAIITNNAGMVLPALFLIRTVIEQFWVSLGLRAEGERATGDEMGARYKARLPSDFNNRFPSLTEIYDSVSTALHTANADQELFERSLEMLNEHFDARRLFKIE